MIYFISAQMVATSNKKLKKEVFYFNGKINLEYDDFDETVIMNRFYDEIINLYGYSVDEVRNMGLALVISNITPLVENK